jgi:hypothetical protein
VYLYYWENECGDHCESFESVAASSSLTLANTSCMSSLMFSIASCFLRGVVSSGNGKRVDGNLISLAPRFVQDV